MLKLFVTGGTFDKEYNELTGQLFFTRSHVEEVLNRGRNRVPIDVETLMLVDSLEMTNAMRQQITTACRNAIESRIVVTHGTDTMAETARVILDAAIPQKTIVLTGAMIPYTFGSSDGLFNLASALAFAQTLTPGVYVAMNGRIFHAGNVRKNRESGCFEELLNPTG